MQPIPKQYLAADCEHFIHQWSMLAGQQEDNALASWITAATEDPGVRPLLEAISGNSSYLSRLLLLNPAVAYQALTQGLDKTYAQMIKQLATTDITLSREEVMRTLRLAKGRIALLVALADIGSMWNLEQVTRALSEFAQHCLSLTIHVLLAAAHKRGDIVLPHQDVPSKESGVIILGMGKLGAYELNYSSDIDLIVLFDPGRLGYKGRHNEQQFMSALAHDLVQFMQERTSDGYVFRTDLRLRPDPASTPPAITLNAAHYYYESVGQNWERAAMIKARPVAGDLAAGRLFLQHLTPFMWRRNLDFAAINDIHSIKRQMDSFQNKTIQLKGHNIKLGMGGIREIEFYVQIHQLIWGGRDMSLRARGTCETLATLFRLGLIDHKTEQTLRTAYEFLRRLEHRLQMINDEQTHSLPETEAGIAHVACFMGYESATAFSQALLDHLHAVHDIYAASFKSADNLGDQGNLVFTGVSHDPETLKTLKSMGYENPETVSEIVMGWHHGSTRATRTKRARELLTELMPALLKRMAETAKPDAAFLRFNEFLRNLPAGVQLFSLFSQNPQLLGLIADILGSAPTLSDHLSKSPSLLDAVLYRDFYETLPTPQQLAAQIRDAMDTERDFEDRMEGLRRFRNEKQFQAGVQFLKHMITAEQAGFFLSDLTDLMIAQTVTLVMEEFKKSYGSIKNSQLAVLALGKLGSREMTFSSDIDLVFIYDVEDFEALSDGEKSFNASVYYNRLCQRILNALSAPSRDGRLYEVDTRLRPSGKQGLLAVSCKALEHYFEELAWTFETMALTRARVVAAEDSLKTFLNAFVIKQIAKPRDPQKLRADVHDMRERIEKEFGTTNPWNIKYARGGMIDIDFIAQYLMLLHAPATPGARPGSTAAILQWLKDAGSIDVTQADTLFMANYFLGQLFHMLRLCSSGTFDEATALPGLQKLLSEAVKEKDFAAVKQRLIGIEHLVHANYTALLVK